jgi:hypothetical protein
MNDLSHPPAYADDFLLWLDAQAALLHDRKLDLLDIPNLYEELLAMAGNIRRELASRLRVLLVHLLKCQYQPSHHTRNWTFTIIEQRSEIESLIEQCPSLRRELPATLSRRYAQAVRDAAQQTRLPSSAFPATLPYTAEQILDPDFLPGA